MLMIGVMHVDNYFYKSKPIHIQAINSGEGVEKREPSYTVGANAN